VTSASLVHPEWLSAITSAILVWAVALIAARRLAGRRSLRLLGARLPPRRLTLASDAMLFVAALAVAIALLGPRIGERVVRVPVSGIDVVFLIDVSRSMDARDTPPSRLDRAGRAVEEILARLPPGDRAGLAAFAGRGLLLAPLTPDHGALVDLLAALDSDLIAPASSNLGAGVNAALTAFESGSDRPRILIVASDGEDSRRSREIGIEAARALGVRIITIALGSEIGSVVPDGERALRDGEGAIVMSRRNRDVLARLASETNGEAFVGDEFGKIDFARAAASLQRDAGAADGWIEQRVAVIGTTPFAMVAFGLLLLEGLPRPRRRLWRRLTASLAVVSVLSAAGAHGDESRMREVDDPRARSREAAEARVRARPDDARAHLDLGLASLAAERNEAAMRAFQASTVFAHSSELAAVAYYDLGVAALANGDREAARDAFFAALDIDPSDEQARFNLEWALRNSADPKSDPAPEGVSESAAENTSASDSDELSGEPRDRVPEIPTLSAAERRRWLERARDDARPWLRAAAATSDEFDPHSTRPAW